MPEIVPNSQLNIYIMVQNDLDDFKPYLLVCRFKGSDSVVNFYEFITISEAYNFINANFDMLLDYRFARNLESYHSKF